MGVAERALGTVFDMVTTMLHGQQCSLKYWLEAAFTAVYVLNRVNTSALPKGVTPHELWTGEKPDCTKSGCANAGLGLMIKQEKSWTIKQLNVFCLDILVVVTDD
mmetsp:Transcript_8068/g.10010  ORF Transcript_8068/g.10010 Transcript_8068/m.10010 type:complete len:105 (-) Transcript_8068:368-682(-)